MSSFVVVEVATASCCEGLVEEVEGVVFLFLLC